MNFAVALLGPDCSNFLERFKMLMTKYWTYVQAAVIHTRSYREGLELIDNLYPYLKSFRVGGLISVEEYERFDSRLISLKLRLFDYLDWWKEYVELFECVRSETTYYMVYSRELGSDRIFDSYLIESHGGYHRVHFLYLHHFRYEVIRRKFVKWERGDKVGNLRHKPQAELTEEEIQRRFDVIMKAAQDGQDIIPFC